MTITTKSTLQSANASVAQSDDDKASTTSLKAPIRACDGETTAKSESINVAACADQDDKLPGLVDSFDHVTFWVGNAKQSATFYMTQFGFQSFAFRGLETGSRDLACHVVKLNDTIIQFVSAVEPNNEKINNFLLSHGDAIKDVAFRVENIENLLKHAIKEGAELVNPLEVITFNPSKKSGLADGDLGKYVVKRATIKTFGDVTHTFIERNYEYERAKFLPGYQEPSIEVSEDPDQMTSYVFFQVLTGCFFLMCMFLHIRLRQHSRIYPKYVSLAPITLLDSFHQTN